MIKRPTIEAASRASLRLLSDAALHRVTGGSAPSIEVEIQGPVPSMREIVHIQ